MGQRVVEQLAIAERVPEPGFEGCQDFAAVRHEWDSRRYRMGMERRGGGAEGRRGSRSSPPEAAFEIGVGQVQHDRPAVRAGVGVLGGEELGDQGLELLRRQGMVHLDRRLAGERGGEVVEDPLAEVLRRCLAVHRETQEQRLSLRRRQHGGRRGYRERPARELGDLEADRLERRGELDEAHPLAARELEHQRRDEALRLGPGLTASERRKRS